MPTFSVQVNVIVNAQDADEAAKVVQEGIDYALEALVPNDDEDNPLGVQSASIGEIEVV